MLYMSMHMVTPEAFRRCYEHHVTVSFVEMFGRDVSPLVGYVIPWDLRYDVPCYSDALPIVPSI
jgi:hypothetical protein